jgi:hypothetical protein
MNFAGMNFAATDRFSRDCVCSAETRFANRRVCAMREIRRDGDASDERAFAISMVNRYTHRPYMNAEVL